MTAWVERVASDLLDAVHGGPGPGGLQDGVVDFSVNVNPFGPAPAVRDAWTRADPAAYPDPSAVETRRAASELWKLPIETVRFGAGATDFLHRAALAWLEPGAVGVVPEPCFAEYVRAVTIARGRVVRVPPADEDGTLDLAATARAARRHRARVVYLGRPNTPTGEAVGLDALETLRSELPGECLLVLDESFLSFEAGSVGAPPTLGPAPRVISVRSVTKDCGLAGLRAGFAVGPSSVMEALDRVALPWSASAPAQLGARVSLEPGSVEYLTGTLRRVRAELRRLERDLTDLGLQGRPSSANFACVRLPREREVVTALAERGLRVRDCASFGLPAHIRVGVRRPEQNRRLVSALRDLLPDSTVSAGASVTRSPRATPIMSTEPEKALEGRDSCA